MRRAFTLIELLIVVAIIAILAAIAVPNFLEAQTRSKVSRVKADMRSIGTGLESYAVDHNRYPPGVNATSVSTDYDFFFWPIHFETRLTTPIAYLTSANIFDPFKPSKSALTGTSLVGKEVSFQYICLDPAAEGSWMWLQWNFGSPQDMFRPVKGWVLGSFGPSRNQRAIEWFAQKVKETGVYPNTTLTYDPTDAIENKPWGMIYDPTNGTVSLGEIARWGGEYPAYCGHTMQ